MIVNQKNTAQADYYARIGLYPSRHSGSDAEALSTYMALRCNLYERLLSVPLGLLRGQDVLDLGCGTGEAAAVYALMGAKVTLVDADKRVWEPLNTLFEGLNCASAVVERVTSPAETYIPTRRFTLAMAEGFLFTCPNRDEIVRRLMEALNPGGLLSISFPDRLGSFMEFLKKAAFVRTCALRGIEDLLCAEAIDAGRALLGATHKTLPNPRPFDIWLKDCICSPFLDQQYCWSAPELLAASNGGLYYSSSPSIYAADRLGWYKNVVADRDWNRAALHGYDARVADFMFGFPVQLPEGSAADFAEQSRAFLNQLGEWFDSPLKDPPVPPAAWFDAIEKSDLVPGLSTALHQFFVALAANTPQSFAQKMQSASAILNIWGKSYHYLVMMRDRS